MDRLSLAAGLGIVLGVTPAWGGDLPAEWTLAQVARPGLGGLPYGMHYDRQMPAINNRGDWAIGTDEGVLVNGLLLTGPQFNRSHSGLDMNDLGVVVWAGSVSTGDGGIFLYDIGAGAGGFVTDGPDTRYSKYNPVINNAGLIVYGGAVDGQDSINAHDLVTGESRVLVLGDGSVVRLGERAAVNDAGQIAYYDEGQNRGLWRIEADGSVTDMPDPVRWDTPDQLWMNDLGQVAAMTDDDEIWRFSEDGVDLLARLPVGPGSSLFRDIRSGLPMINNEGWVAFHAENRQGREAIYMTDGIDFARIAGVGDLVLTDLGWGEISMLEPIEVALNDAGDVLLAAHVDLLDGGGVAGVVFMATVPAPGWAGLAACAGAGLALRRRRG